MAGTSDRVKERNRIKRLIVKTKSDIVKKATKLNKISGVSFELLIDMQLGLDRLDKLNRHLNALSAPIDERVILEQSLKRSTKDES